MLQEVQVRVTATCFELVKVGRLQARVFEGKEGERKVCTRGWLRLLVRNPHHTAGSSTSLNRSNSSNQARVFLEATNAQPTDARSSNSTHSVEQEALPSLAQAARLQAAQKLITLHHSSAQEAEQAWAGQGWAARPHALGLHCLPDHAGSADHWLLAAGFQQACAAQN